MSQVHAPQRALVVGAGIVGLSCAWSLQEHGVNVEVVDQTGPGAGASWGNAGYLAPALTVPLPEPALLRYGMRAVLDPRSPVQLPFRANGELVRFLLRMVRNCTGRRWSRAMDVYRELNTSIFDSFDAQRAGGVAVPDREADVLAAFAAPHQAAGLLHEFEGVVGSGQQVDIRFETAASARALEPNLSDRTAVALRIIGQRFLDPVRYVAALSKSVSDRGGTIVTDTKVTSVERRGNKIFARCSDGDRDCDVVVLANGAWLPELARPHGVRLPQYGGRGYSFSVPAAEPLSGPLYLPVERAALAPRGDRIRVAGVMEFQRPDAPLVRARIAQTIRGIRPLLDGVDWHDIRDEWVGARPLTADGVPLVGASATKGVFVAGGHGMWGVTLGPLTGQLLADHIVSGARPAQLDALDPLR